MPTGSIGSRHADREAKKTMNPYFSWYKELNDFDDSFVRTLEYPARQSKFSGVFTVN